MSDSDRTRAYAQWLVDNKDKQGTPEYQKVADAYRVARQQAQQQPEQTAMQKFGDVTSAISDSIVEVGTGLVGAPADIAVSLGEDDPFLPTSDELNQALSSIGLHSGAQGREDRSEVGNVAKAAGDVFTIGSTLATAPLAVAKQTPKLVDAADSVITRVGRDIMDTVRRDPNAVRNAELAANVGAAQGAAAAEAIAPGDEDIRTVGEIGGAIANPATLVNVLIRSGKGLISSVMSALSGAGRKNRAAKIAQDLVRESDMTPEQLAKVLDELEPGAPVASQTGNEGLMRLEKFVGRVRPRSVNENEKALQAFYTDIRASIDALSAKGDPESLRAAAVLRRNYHEQLIDDALMDQQQAVQSAAGRLSTEATGQSTGEAARNTLENARSMLKQTERDLWKTVPKDVEVDTSPLKTAYDEIRAEATPELLKERPIFLESSIRRLTGVKRSVDPDTGDVVDGGAALANSGELKSLRSDLLSEWRDLRAQDRNSEARIVKKLADAAGETLKGLDGYEEAASFTKVFNDRWSRTFAGKIDQTTRQGGAALEPAETLEKGFAGGGTTGNVRFQQLEDAAAQADAGLGVEVRIEQEKFLRQLANKFINDTDGTVKEGLNDFLRVNKTMLERFPGLRNQLTDAKEASRLLKDVQKNSKARMKELEKSALGKITGRQDPTAAVASILKGKNPDAEIASLVDEIGKSANPEEALRGLNTSFLDHAGQQSRGSFQALQKEIPFDLMEKHGTMPAEELKRLKLMVERVAEVEANAARTAAMRSEDIATPVESALYDLGLRIGGAGAGAASLTGTIGGSLTGAAAGVRFLREKLQSLPFTGVMAILDEASRDPKLMADLMRRYTGPDDQRKVWARINGALIAAGITDEEDNQ